MGQWITTNLESGALSSDNYNSSITGLTANSIYEYRAYMIVDGLPYYGETLQGITSCSYTYPLTVSTGIASNIADTTMRFCNNSIVHSGTSLVTEYGVLYTQNPIFGTDTGLVYGNYPLGIAKTSICNAISEGQDYFISSLNEVCGLNPNTITYYRAFATNGALEYGDVCTTMTLPTTPTAIELCVDRPFNTSLSSATGDITFDPVIPSSEIISFILNIVQNNLNLGATTTEIVHSTNGVPTSIYYCTVNNNESSNDNITIAVNSNDSVCWQHSTSGDVGSYSDIVLSSIDFTSFGVTATINGSNCCDRVYSVPSEFAP